MLKHTAVTNTGRIVSGVLQLFFCVSDGFAWVDSLVMQCWKRDLCPESLVIWWCVCKRLVWKVFMRNLGQNFSFNICDTGHHQDFAAFYGIGKTHPVVKICVFKRRENGKFHAKSSRPFNHPPQNFFSFWPLLDTPKLWWTANFHTQESMGTLFLSPAKNRPSGQKRALATRRDGTTPRYEIAFFWENIQFLT